MSPRRLLQGSLFCLTIAMSQMLLAATGPDAAGNGAVNRDQIRFRTVGIREGLSSTTARAVAQDEKGFVWLGTQEGLNRYDGYAFRVFRADSERADSPRWQRTARAVYGLALWAAASIIWTWPVPACNVFWRAVRLA